MPGREKHLVCHMTGHKLRSYERSKTMEQLVEEYGIGIIMLVVGSRVLEMFGQLLTRLAGV